MLALREVSTTIMFVGAAVAAVAILCIGVYEHFTETDVYKDDNAAEEMVEAVIQNQTGLDVDLSPLSKED